NGLESNGTTGQKDRAFGTRPTEADDLILIGAEFQNKTGAVITSLKIEYRGEQWRDVNKTKQALFFEFGETATSLTSKGYTGVGELDSEALKVTGGPVALNGNAAGNNTVLSHTINNLNIPVDGIFWIRWTRSKSEGASSVLAIDDLNVTVVPEPASLALA